MVNFDPHLLERLGVALAIGLLIGMERGWERRDRPEGSRTAGFRTFGLIGLLGGITAMLGGDARVPLIGVVAPAPVIPRRPRPSPWSWPCCSVSSLNSMKCSGGSIARNYSRRCACC